MRITAKTSRKPPASHRAGDARPGVFLSILLKRSLLLSSLYLASCAELEAYDEAPPSNAIVGMWTNARGALTPTILLSDDAGNALGNILFMADGTGISRSTKLSTVSAPFVTSPKYENVPIKWAPDGGGWTVEFPNRTCRFRVSKKRGSDGSRSLFVVFPNHGRLRYTGVPE